MDKLTRPCNPKNWPENWPQQYKLVACGKDPQWCEDWKEQHECKCDAFGDCENLLGAYEHTDLTPDQVTALQADNKRLQQWVDDLQSGMYVNCVYCGHRYGPEDKVPSSMADALKAHIEQCPKHPMSALKAELATYKADEAAGRLVRLPYSPGTEFNQSSDGESPIVFTGGILFEVKCDEDTDFVDETELEAIIRDCERDSKARCRVCGCTDDHACPGGCYWVEPDLCSACNEGGGKDG